VVQSSSATIPIPAGKNQILIGRQSTSINVYPDIDLTPYGGDGAGVSRRHAMIYIQGGQLFIQDLESANGTYLNQQRLAPNQPYPLQSGSEIWLGQMKLYFYA
jgi:pSer/pThr/pTyr-binding forkhead associated (FHA) protein